MSVDYQVNGTSIPGVQSDWRRIMLRENPDGTQVYSNYAINRWYIALASMATFEALRAVAGRAVVLVSNQMVDRETQTTYSTAYMPPAVNGRHDGVNVREITLEIRVKVF